jgi:hypothetical protein
LKKKLGRDKNKKSLTANVSRTTEVNDPNEIDATPEEGNKSEYINEEVVAKNIQTNVPNVVKDNKEKPILNKNLKDKHRPDGNKQQENIVKSKGKPENTQGNTGGNIPVNPKHNQNQPKNKQPQQQQVKQNVVNNSSEDESKDYLY